jgi:hypothetical protein
MIDEDKEEIEEEKNLMDVLYVKNIDSNPDEIFVEPNCEEEKEVEKGEFDDYFDGLEREDNDFNERVDVNSLLTTTLPSERQRFSKRSKNLQMISSQYVFVIIIINYYYCFC